MLKTEIKVRRPNGDVVAAHYLNSSQPYEICWGDKCFKVILERKTLSYSYTHLITVSEYETDETD